MDFIETINKACAECPMMGEAVASAYQCIFEGTDPTATAAPAATTGANDAVAVSPEALTENPEAAKILANIATKATAEKQKVDQAQAALDKTTDAAKQTLAQLQKEASAKETLGEQNQAQPATANATV